jgi:hypothetical protein
MVLACLLAAPSSAVTADRAAPQIVEKPLLVIPGETVLVSVYNGGHEVWTDLVVTIADASVLVPDILGPESSVDVFLSPPLTYLLETDAIDVVLSYRGEVLDRRSLPVRVEWPIQQLILDPAAPGGPEFLVLLDASQYAGQLRGVQVEAALLSGGKVVYMDFLGPFYPSQGERFIARVPVPQRFVAPGAVARGTFTEGGTFLTETKVDVAGDAAGQRSILHPLLFVLFLIILIALLFLLVDSSYHRRPLRVSWLILRRRR